MLWGHFLRCHIDLPAGITPDFLSRSIISVGTNTELLLDVLPVGLSIISSFSHCIRSASLYLVIYVQYTTVAWVLYSPKLCEVLHRCTPTHRIYTVSDSSFVINPLYNSWPIKVESLYGFQALLRGTSPTSQVCLWVATCTTCVEA